MCASRNNTTQVYSVLWRMRVVVGWVTVDMHRHRPRLHRQQDVVGSSKRERERRV